MGLQLAPSLDPQFALKLMEEIGSKFKEELELSHSAVESHLG